LIGKPEALLLGQDQPQQPASRNVVPQAKYLPRDCVGFLSLEPARFFKSDAGRSLLQCIKEHDQLESQEFKEIQWNWTKRFGMEAADIERITFFVENLAKNWKAKPLVLVTNIKPFTRSKVLDCFVPGAIEKHLVGKDYFVKETDAEKALHFLDDHNFLFGATSSLEFYWKSELGPTAGGPLADSLRMLAEGHHAVLGLNCAALPWEFLRVWPPMWQPIAPLKSCLSLAFKGDFDKDLEVHGRFAFPDNQSKQGVASFQAGLVLGELLTELKDRAPKEEKQDPDKWEKVTTRSLLRGIENGLRKAQIEQRGGQVQMQLKAPPAQRVVCCYLDELARFAESPEWVQTQENLREIALAMNNHNDNLGAMPPAAICDKNGKPLLSWRVAVLPYLNHQKLYDEFKLDEPWNSEHNAKLLPRMPRVYVPVRGAHPLGVTFYQVFTGPDTPFQGNQRPHIPATFPDGTLNTILIVETAKPVPWTKPEDIPYSDKKPLPKLGGLFEGGFHVALWIGPLHLPRQNLRRNFAPRHQSARRLYPRR
jgi:hypothetical protein